MRRGRSGQRRSTPSETRSRPPVTALSPNRPFGPVLQDSAEVRVATTATDRADAPRRFLDLPRDLDSEAQLAGRYGPVGVEAGEANAPICALDIDSVSAQFDPIRCGRG